MDTVALTAGEPSHDLLLIGPLEPKAVAVGAAVHGPPAQFQRFDPAGDFLEDGVFRIQRIAVLIHGSDFYGLADCQPPGADGFLPEDHAEERRLAGPIASDHT